MQVIQTASTVVGKSMALTQVYVDCLTEEVVFIYSEVDAELKKVDGGAEEKKLFPASVFPTMTIAEMLGGDTSKVATEIIKGEVTEVAKPEPVVDAPVTPIK